MVNKNTNLERCTKQELIKEIYSLRSKLSYVEHKYTAKITFSIEGIEEEVYEAVQRAFEAVKKTVDNTSSQFCDNFEWDVLEQEDFDHGDLL